VSDADTAKNASAHLLVVDDLEVNRDLLARRVRKLGHTVVFAENGIEALERLAAETVDLVLLDITMPGMDGYEALSRMKADPALAHIPVVMVTAIDGVESVVRCLELGADDYVTKPFNPVILRARIESSLAKKRAADLSLKLLQSLSREMAIAQRIQLGFLPEALPELPGWEIAASCAPAKQVSGDFFDALILPGGNLAFTVADVCDKGVGAALYMALFRSLLRAIASEGSADETPADTLARTTAFTNDYIATVHGRDNMFATVFTAILNPANGRMDYINAGHDAPMIRRGSATELERLAPAGLALGMMEGGVHEVQTIELRAGDALFAFSDGLTEAIGESGPFGEERVIAALQEAGSGAAALIARIGAELATHVGDAPAHDDVTMLCLTVK